jgi:hypothetical protein
MPEFLTVGRRFGRGVILDLDVGRDRYGNVLVQLICDCETVYQARASSVRNGSRQSCGCLRPGRVTASQWTSHGLSRHPLYGIWALMLHRCENLHHRHYADYGGRGITVWGPWHDPARFITDVEAEIGPRPPGCTPGGRPAWSLNRIDNNGDYRPGNIEWADWARQNRNKRPKNRDLSAETGNNSRHRMVIISAGRKQGPQTKGEPMIAIAIALGGTGFMAAWAYAIRLWVLTPDTLDAR